MHHFLKELPSCQDRNASQVVWIYVHVYWRSCIPLFVTPWTVVRQAPLSMGFVFQMRILEWVAISFSGGSSWLRDRTCLVSCVSGIMGGPFTCSFIREALFEFNCLINRALGYLAMILQVWFMTHDLGKLAVNTPTTGFLESAFLTSSLVNPYAPWSLKISHSNAHFYPNFRSSLSLFFFLPTLFFLKDLFASWGLPTTCSRRKPSSPLSAFRL